jgi:zinc/manganese transport system substrate-binding protein
MMRKTHVALAALILLTARSEAALDVVTTTSSMGLLARTIGGTNVKLTTLAPPDRDAHFLQATPSMMLAARRAQLLVAVGADLEVGWLPALTSSSANPRILPGQLGYFEAAAQVELIERGAAADRSKGDVHPGGNPHIYLDPPRMAQVGKALATRLGQLDPPHAAQYSQNAEAFAQAVSARLPRWKERANGTRGVLLFHKDGNYLANLLALPILGYIEPLPGIPPSAQHIRDLVGRLKGQRGVIVYTVFQPSSGPDALARALGWPKVQLPLEPAPDATSDGYFGLIDRWVDAFSLSKP